jgi:hypothetical protein
MAPTTFLIDIAKGSKMTGRELRVLLRPEERAAAKLIAALDAYRDAPNAAAAEAATGRIRLEAASFALHHDLRRGKQGRTPVSRYMRQSGVTQ